MQNNNDINELKLKEKTAYELFEDDQPRHDIIEANNRSVKRKLERQDGKIAGVCGAIGHYLGIDPTFIRIIFAILLLPGGFPGLVPYLFLWVLIPKRK